MSDTAGVKAALEAARASAMMTRPHGAGFHPSRVLRVSRGEPANHERRGRPSRQRPSNDLVSPRILRFLVSFSLIVIAVAPQVTIFLLFVVYAASGPSAWLWHRRRAKRTGLRAGAA